MLSEEEVERIAKLAYLKLERSEVESLTGQLGAILGFVEQLNSIDLKGVEPMSHVHGSTNVFREDETGPHMTIDKVMQNAPDKSGRFIRVPIIIDQEG
jgi:aspartyl-tRNA(Asn)/glutamyl-tRNA(Gln) amidotransferase subunit C